MKATFEDRMKRLKLLDAQISTLESNGNGVVPVQSASVSVAELLSDPTLTKPPTRVGDYLTWKGLFTLLAATQKTGKSELACADALSVLKRGKNVLYIGPDEPINTTLARLKGYDRPDLMDNIRMLRPSEIIDWDAIMRACDETQPSAIYFDSVTKMASLLCGTSRFPKEVPAAGEGERWRVFMDVFGDLAHDTGVPVCMMDHVPHNNPNRTYGSIHKESAVDVIACQTRADGSNINTLTFRGRRGPSLDTRHLEWMPNDGGLFREVTDDEVPQRGGKKKGDYRKEQNIRLVKSALHGGNVLSASQIQEATGLTRNQWRTTKDNMLSELDVVGHSNAPQYKLKLEESK